jgi:hypothetical protein
MGYRATAFQDKQAELVRSPPDPKYLLVPRPRNNLQYHPNLNESCSDAARNRVIRRSCFFLKADMRMISPQSDTVVRYLG